MGGKITINTERCKGCGLCVKACPKGSIVIATHINKSGYFPAQVNGSSCTGCAMCAIVCPDATIEVYYDSKIVAVESKKKKTSLTREKL